MTDYQITKAVAHRDTDVLEIEAIALDTQQIIKTSGWVSAMTNYFPDDVYSTDDDGNLMRAEDAEPQAMSNDERKAYILGLVASADVRPAIVDAPVPVEEDLTNLFS